MKPGSVIVDVSIDQGGTTEVSRPTTHSDPVYIGWTELHYCVPNIPSAVSLTTTEALSNATLKYGLMIAKSGNKSFNNRILRTGLNTFQGHVTNEGCC